MANGVTCDPDTQLVGRDGWLLEKDSAQLEIDRALAATAFHDSSSHLISYKINARAAQTTGARGITCSGFITRSFFQLPSHVTRPFSMPRTDLLEEGAPGGITTRRARSDSDPGTAKKSRREE